MNIKATSTLANFSVGEFCIVPSRNLVSKAGQESSITPKMLLVLTELAKHQGETLSKEHLIIAIWGSINTSDMVLSRAISDLRKVFSDSAKQQNYIETVTKQGYRLKQPVIWQTPSHQTQSNSYAEIEAKQDEKIVSEIKSTTKENVQAWYQITKNKLLTFITFLFMFLSLVYWLTTINKIHSNNEISGKLTLTNLTLNDETESYTRFSFDGKYLAYTTNSEVVDGRRLKLHSLVSNKIIPVGSISSINDDSYDLAPAFSPDGKYVAYKHLTMEGCQIRIFDILNAKERDLTQCPFSKTQGLDWSPDGAHLVTTVFNHIEKIEGLALIDSETGKISMLQAPKSSASGYLWPRFSPNGKSLAVVYFQPNNNLSTVGLVNLASGEFTEILRLGEKVTQVAWDETDDFLYYLVTKSIDAGIWKINLKTKKTQLITNVESNGLDFNKVTKQLVYINRDEKFNVWRTHRNVEGEFITEPILKHLPQTNFPSLSPENDKLAFISTESGIDSLWISSLSDQAHVLVLQSKPKERLSEPTWSPDGKQLLVSALSKDSSRMIQFNVELGNASLFPSENNVKMGKWSHDGTMMYWYEQIDGVWHVLEKDLKSQKQKVILSQPIFRFEILDKNNLHYQKIGTIKVHSRQMTSENSLIPKDTMLLALKDYHTWDAHLDSLYYISHSKKMDKLMLFRKDLSSKISEELYPVNSMLTLSGRHLSVTKDGSEAYYTKLVKAHTDIVLMSVE
jgi:DNA-binding winged helix-turn-helix (wHTH) protein/Tol biopolymer transport system component